MTLKLISGALLVALAGVGLFLITREPGAGTGAGRVTERCTKGTPTATSSGRRVTVDRGCGKAKTFAVASGLLRNPASDRRGNLAYVDDLKGADTLTAIVAGRKITIPTHGEVKNPSWSQDGKLAWAEDLRRLEVWSPRDGSVRSISRPSGSVSVFAPVFATNSHIDAVVQEPSRGIDADEDGLNNLYAYDLARERWSRVTSFHATGDGWSVIRTPVRAGKKLYFVRVHGHATATGLPSFDLYEMAGGRATKIASLEPETYLAGYRNGHLLFSARSKACKGEWGLFSGSPGHLNRIGCGSALADPLSGADPDLAGPRGSGGPHGTPGRGGGASPKDLVVVIGDFPSAAAAEDQAGAMPAGYYATVLNHAAAPEAVRPGAWIVAVPPGDGSSPGQTLRKVRPALTGPRIHAYLAVVDGMGAGD